MGELCKCVNRYLRRQWHPDCPVHGTAATEQAMRKGDERRKAEQAMRKGDERRKAKTQPLNGLEKQP